ncbi:hypothetical protein EYF80_065879 [Liparis tanakae]|uniref:Uncharacterized protein n=1 Tax=Liparis tanakae TaxID=230148 RepID=A0A4Z2E5F9_9TELE|nr:hypothetical protein EYF80_065879 [Liparis tanakae]
MALVEESPPMPLSQVDVFPARREVVFSFWNNNNNNNNNGRMSAHRKTL